MIESPQLQLVDFALCSGAAGVCVHCGLLVCADAALHHDCGVLQGRLARHWQWGVLNCRLH